MIRTTNLYVRGGKLYISAYTEYGRVRVSTGLSDSKEHRAQVLANAKEYIFRHLRAEKAPTRSTSLKLRDVGKEFLSTIDNLKESTLIAYKSIFHQMLKGIGNRDIRLYSVHNVGEFFQSKPPKYEHFFNRLIDYVNAHQNLDLKPIKVKRVRTEVEQKEINPFSLKEMGEILSHASGELRTYLYIAFLSGARSGEILALTWQDINLTDRKIAITKNLTPQGKITSPKTKSSVRYVDMLEPLYEYLSAQSVGEGRIISTPKYVLREQFYALLDTLGIARRVLYNTRHSFASIMLSEGEEPLWVAAMLGHKNLNITYEFYAKFIPKKCDRAQFLKEVL